MMRLHIYKYLHETAGVQIQDYAYVHTYICCNTQTPCSSYKLAMCCMHTSGDIFT